MALLLRKIVSELLICIGDPLAWWMFWLKSYHLQALDIFDMWRHAHGFTRTQRFILVVVLPVGLRSLDFQMTSVLLTYSNRGFTAKQTRTWWLSYAQLKTFPSNPTSVNWTHKTCLLVLAAAFTLGGFSRHHHGVSWVGSTLRSPVSALLHLLDLQLKPSLTGLWAPERLLFTLSLLGFNPGDSQGIGAWPAEVYCWLHRHLMDRFVCQ